MQAYLAAKYMSGPKADAILARTGGLKKKKRRVDSAGPSQSSGASTSQQSIIKDDDGGWGDSSKMDEDEDLTEALVENDRSFKKQRAEGSKEGGGTSTGWTTIREGAARTPSPPLADDEKPQVVETSQQPVAGGLMTSAQLRKTRSTKQESKQQQLTEEDLRAQETVYRDGSGRIIDTKLARAEAARKKREREEREAAKMEWGKGLVQREEEERKKQQIEAEKRRDLAVYKDDEELNAELKAKDRWNDPAAGFLEKKSKKGPRRPQYEGPPPPPNRFGIRPGYRWDGVDRGNGFEKKFFQKHNERKRKGAESYEWGVEDM